MAYKEYGLNNDVGRNLVTRRRRTEADLIEYLRANPNGAVELSTAGMGTLEKPYAAPTASLLSLTSIVDFYRKPAYIKYANIVIGVDPFLREVWIPQAGGEYQQSTKARDILLEVITITKFFENKTHES